MSAADGDETATNVDAVLLPCVRAGKPLEARGARISGQDVERLLEAAPRHDGSPVLHDASFGSATFVGAVSFGGVTFLGDTDFQGATFEGYAGFGAARFRGKADFTRVSFKRRADFRDTSWSDVAYFVEATFEQDARFDGPTVFTGDARFDMATFKGDLFAPRTFEADAWFDRATFDVARHLGPLRAAGRVILDGAAFAQQVTIVMRAASLSAARTEFRSGADILAQSAIIALDGAAFGAPSTVSPATRDTTYGALLGKDDYDEETVPHVVSLQGARVAELALYGIDLRACRFRGARGLDSVHLEQVQFAETPSRWQTTPPWPFPIVWTRRLAIAEEHRWRAERQKADGWWPAVLQVRPSTPNWRESDPPTPHQVAAVYRALRKAQEERKDEPGAADFYYGEMEMRRATRYRRGSAPDGDPADPLQAPAYPLEARASQDSTRRPPAGEKLVLFLYWLTSGYGLRASRALICLMVTVAFSALLLAQLGFDEDVSYGRSLLLAIESSISLLRMPAESESLTTGGELITVALRLLGPLFFGLALLSLRGRVKR